MNLGSVSNKESKTKDLADPEELGGIDSVRDKSELEENDTLGQEDPESVNNDELNETLKNLYHTMDGRNLDDSKISGESGGVALGAEGNGKILEDSRMDIEKNQQDRRVHWNFPKPPAPAPVVPAEILTDEQKAE